MPTTPQWNTTAGLLANVSKGEPFLYALSCNTGNISTTFSVISGAMPDGLVLTGPTNEPQFTYPSIWGNPSVNSNTQTYSFTIRAKDINGNIADRGFSLNVLDPEPSYLFPSANLGIFPDGQWVYTSVAPLTTTSVFPPNMKITGGTLPYALNLDPATGYITGYISPAVLYNSSPYIANEETGKPLLPTSANTANFAFTVQYDSQNSSDFFMIVERQDLYNNSSANTSLPVYHDPIFLDATFANTQCSWAFANINIGIIDGDNIFYQFVTQDFEDNTVGYTLINGNSIPGNVTINPQTGWLSGYINRDMVSTDPYQFQVVAYKSANVFSNSNLQTTAYCTLTVQNPIDYNIKWNSPSNLGALIPGIPSTISVSASVLNNFPAPPIVPAVANCTLKLVDVTIVNGGNAFANGSVYTLQGGISKGNANIIISNVSPTGTITNVTIDPSVIQEYSELPPSLSVIWINETGNANALNAIFDLSFGVDTINILNKGGFYDTATVGFGEAGQANSAVASVIIYNGTIANTVVTKTGDGYKVIPSVVIAGKTNVSPVNPIKYELTSGTIPAGCQLLSNGLLVGLPSSQNFSLDRTTILDTNQTVFDTEFDFTVTASIGQNKSYNYTETDLSGSNVVVQDFQTLIQVSKDFSVNLKTNWSNNITQAPRTNLYLEFLLDENDWNAIFTPLNNESLVPNESIFRQDDFYFGIAPKIRMLLAYGISPEFPETIQDVISQYFHNKTYTLNNLKWAQSTTDGYEVIYIEPLDQFTNPSYQTFNGNISYNTISGKSWAYPATLPNMIRQLNTNLNGFDYTFLPSWMKDLQPNGQVLGFVPAIPLLYVKPGTGKKIMYYLQQYYNSASANISNISATTDRLIWNSGYSQNWDSRPVVTLTAQNITAQISGVSVVGSTATYTITTGSGFANNTVPVNTIFVIQGMSYPVNNGKFVVTASAPNQFSVTNASGVSESSSAGYAYSINLNSNANFIINSSTPTTFTPNLTPRTYSFIGNVTVNLSANISNIYNVASTINNLHIDGIQAGIGDDSELFIQNIYGCPFLLFDGSGTPLANLGLLPTGNANANVNVALVAGWWSNEITQFDVQNPSTDIDTELGIDLSTENCILIITEGGPTSFLDMGTYFDTSDIFLNLDDGSTYLKFANTSFINQGIVTV